LTARVVLVTGFAPFDGARRNPSWQAVRPLDGCVVEGHTVVARQLPTAFGESAERLRRLMARHQPALVLCVGLADGRTALSFERVAVNLDDARIADNAGAQPVDRAVVPGAPAAYFSTLPVKAMARAVQRQGLPAELSMSAGSFVCNHVFFALMNELASGRYPSATGGFVHVPGPDVLGVEQIRAGLEVALAEALVRRAKGLADLKTPGGAIA
jgi:pyroglutamyl-peptidase